MTSNVKGAVAVSVPSVRLTPAGCDWTVIGTVFGFRSRVTVRVRPKLSVAVSCSSRCDGYSWSGATNEPPLPVSDCTTCVWQDDGLVRLQCWRLMCQLSGLGGSATPRKSVAEPENVIVSPTTQVVPVAGDVIVAVGGVPAVTTTEVVSALPPGSLTRRPTVTTPAVV